MTVEATEAGQYRIVDLRAGTYAVSFSLVGFSTVRREDIELTGSFTAVVNADGIGTGRHQGGQPVRLRLKQRPPTKLGLFEGGEHPGFAAPLLQRIDPGTTHVIALGELFRR